jgi:putative DNA primase/helicase
MMRQLLPPIACVGPTLQSLGTNFGLAPLIGKQLALIDDLHLGSHREQAELVSNLKKLTGAGWFTIDRKFKEAWTGTLPVKLVLVANELPQLGDNSGAMAERFIIFETRQSFLGREDETLFAEKLAPEKGGVLLWALEGLRRLAKRRRFTESKTSIAQRRRLKEYGSPVQAFVLEEYDFDSGSQVWKDETFAAWKQYAVDNGYAAGDEAHFSTALFAVGQVRAFKPRDPLTGKQRPAYLGLKRKEEAEDLPHVLGGAR